MQKPGVGQALLAAVLFGISTPISKLLLQSVSPQMLAGLLYLGCGAGLAILWIVHGRSRTAAEANLTTGDVPFLIGAIVFGGVIAPVSLLFGLSRTPAINASLLLNMEAVFTALVAWFVFHENVDRRIALGMVSIVAGGALLSWTTEFEAGNVVGSLAIAGACLSWAIDNNITQRISGRNPIQIAGIKGLCAGALNLGLAFLVGSQAFPNRILPSAPLLGFVSYGLSLTLYVLALRSLGTARAGNYFSTAPFIGALVSVLILHEPVTARLLGAGFLMAFGVWLHLTERHEHWHAHEPLDHAHLHFHDEHHQHTHSSEDPSGEPHSHPHRHERLEHSHPHYPDIHHRHPH